MESNLGINVGLLLDFLHSPQKLG